MTSSPTCFFLALFRRLDPAWMRSASERGMRGRVAAAPVGCGHSQSQPADGRGRCGLSSGKVAAGWDGSDLAHDQGQYGTHYRAGVSPLSLDYAWKRNKRWNWELGSGTGKKKTATSIGQRRRRIGSRGLWNGRQGYSKVRIISSRSKTVARGLDLGP